MNYFSLAAFQILVFAFENLTIICLSVILFAFILLGIYWASWRCTFVSLSNEKFSVIISQKFFLFLYLFLPFLRFPLCVCWYAWQYPRGFLDSSFFFIPFFFLHFRLVNINWPIFKFMDSFFHLCKSSIETL